MPLRGVGGVGRLGGVQRQRQPRLVGRMLATVPELEDLRGRFLRRLGRQLQGLSHEVLVCEGCGMGIGLHGLVSMATVAPYSHS